MFALALLFVFAPAAPELRDGKSCRSVAGDDLEKVAGGAVVLREFSNGEDGLHVSATDAAGNAGRELCVDDCAKLYAAIRSKSPATHVGAAEYVVNIAFGLVSFGGRPVIDLASEYCRRAQADTPSRVRQTTKLLSLVGPALSFEVTQSEEMAGGPPHQRQWWETRDVRTGQRMDVRELVDKTSLVVALRGDKVVREMFADAIQSAMLDDILSRLHGAGDGAGSAFAVHSYDARTNTVALRLAFRRADCGLCPNDIAQIGLRVAPAAAAQTFFRDVQAGNGFTMSSPFAHRLL